MHPSAIHPHYSAPLLNGLRVLIVDDNQEDRALLMDFLGLQGCRVYLACDGQDGIGKATAIVPDLILLDVNMAGCDGMTACRLLKANPVTCAIPVIFLTASSRPEERVRGLEAGAIDYVVKPFDLDEIRLRLVVHIRANRYRATQAAGSPGMDPAAGALDTRLFDTARDLLLARLNETPELATLAGSVGTNPHRLNVAFRLCAGVTVFDFLHQERMKRASRLLSETTMDVQAIAELVGYGAGRNFATAFRKYFGHSPSEVRQRRSAN